MWLILRNYKRLRGQSSNWGWKPQAFSWYSAITIFHFNDGLKTHISVIHSILQDSHLHFCVTCVKTKQINSQYFLKSRNLIKEMKYVCFGNMYICWSINNLLQMTMTQYTVILLYCNFFWFHLCWSYRNHKIKRTNKAKANYWGPLSLLTSPAEYLMAVFWALYSFCLILMTWK